QGVSKVQRGGKPSVSVVAEDVPSDDEDELDSASDVVESSEDDEAGTGSVLAAAVDSSPELTPAADVPMPVTAPALVSSPPPRVNCRPRLAVRSHADTERRRHSPTSVRVIATYSTGRGCLLHKARARAPVGATRDSGGRTPARRCGRFLGLLLHSAPR